MNMILYCCRDADNVLNKTLENPLEKEIRLKDMADIDNFTVVLYNDESIDFLLYNYAYIPYFKRYYFIERIVIAKGNIVNISLIVDVLQSFQADIQRIVTDKVETEFIYSGKSIETAEEKQTVLVTIGGS